MIILSDIAGYQIINNTKHSDLLGELKEQFNATLLANLLEEVKEMKITLRDLVREQGKHISNWMKVS